jgi:hypothetical protein
MTHPIPDFPLVWFMSKSISISSIQGSEIVSSNPSGCSDEVRVEVREFRYSSRLRKKDE